MEYIRPLIQISELNIEEKIMLLVSNFDEKHHTEHIEWDNSVDL